ncbi:cell wall hydrolase [Ahrensia kielensis]|uniref:Cell wall hydrolase n=1 Tax=Ahrensia kielensis TaxID=76980 RepID=A0ABU9T861_9HYPH
MKITSRAFARAVLLTIFSTHMGGQVHAANLTIQIYPVATIAHLIAGNAQDAIKLPEEIVTRTGQGLETICMANALYHEARGEKLNGQKAVAQVILNRVKSEAYPDSVCGVVYENAHMRNRCQFSFACDRVDDTPQESDAYEAALIMAQGAVKYGIYAEGLTPNFRDPAQTEKSQITHYHTTAVSPSWGKKLRPIKTIGRHIFYRSERVAKSIAS